MDFLVALWLLRQLPHQQLARRDHKSPGMLVYPHRNRVSPLEYGRDVHRCGRAILLHHWRVAVCAIPNLDAELSRLTPFQ
jgi:hypothetical protein